MKKKMFKKTSSISIIIILIIISTMLVSSTSNNLSNDLMLEEEQNENTYLLGLEKHVNTTINGDLFLITTESNIQGIINKDLNAISGNITIKGVIGDDLRLISGSADITAYIFNELRAISEIITTSNTTVVNGKTTIKATHAKIYGTFNNDLKIDAKRIELNAIIKGNVELEGKTITISPETRIGGTLTVPKGTDVPENTVSKEIIYVEKEIKTTSTSELLLGKIILFLLIAILAGFISLIAKNKTHETLENVNIKPLLSLLIGFLSVIILPIIAIISFITIITAPIGALIILSLLALLIITPALGALLIGKQILEMIRPRREIRIEILLGTLTLVVLSFIPGFLTLAIFLFYILFLGTIIQQTIPKKNKTKKVNKKKTKKKKKKT